MVWGKAGSTTLSGTGDTLTTTGMTASETNQFLFHTLASGNADTRYKYNSTDQMALRYNQNGGSDATSTSDTPPQQIWVGYGDHFNVNYMANVSGEEKLVITFDVTATATGAGTAPARMESVHKSVQSDQITEINISNGGSGDYLTDSNLTVLGSDMTPASAVTFPTNVQVGSRAEITDSRKMYNLHDPGTNVLYEDATGQSNTSSHGTVVFIGDNATYATLFSRITATNTTHPHPAVNVDTPNKAFSSSDPWTIELTFKESYTIPSGSTITYNSYNNGQGARLKYLDFQVYTGSTWENITGTITNPNHSDGDVETISGRWVKYMTSTTTTEKTGTKFRIRMWDSWDNFVTNGRHYIGGIELKIPIGNVEWQEIGT